MSALERDGPAASSVLTLAGLPCPLAEEAVDKDSTTPGRGRVQGRWWRSSTALRCSPKEEKRMSAGAAGARKTPKRH